MRLKVGVVGSGLIAVVDYYPVFGRESVRDIMEVSGICDVVPGRAEEHCRRFGFGVPYTDYDQMLKKAPIDIVAVLSPIPCHFDQARKALLAGKHVYVQKTMTETTAQALELNRIAHDKGLLLCASPGQMILPSHVDAKRIIDGGALGKICFVRGQGGHMGHENQELLGIDPSWYYKKGGGPMMDVAVYAITSITGLVGPAKRVSAFSGIAIPDRSWKDKKLEVSMDDNTVIMLDFGDSRFAEIHGNYCARRFKGPQIEMFGSKGVMYLGGWCDPQTPIEVYSEEPFHGERAGWYKPVPPLDAPPQPYTIWTVADLLHLVDCVREKKPLKVSSAQAAHVIEIIEKGYESAKAGHVMELTTAF